MTVGHRESEGKENPGSGFANEALLISTRPEIKGLLVRPDGLQSVPLRGPL